MEGHPNKIECWQDHLACQVPPDLVILQCCKIKLK